MAILFALPFYVVSTTLMIPSGKNVGAATNPLETAIEEMNRANYFAFVMLLNMAPPHKIPSNVTFLMPSNQMLGNTIIPQNGVLEFLLHHSIPSPLGFEYLKHLPTNSIIPSAEPKFMLKVINNGRWRFFLNDVRLISPDICTAGSSIRCHGIDGLLVRSNQTSALPASPLPPPSPIIMGPSLPPAPTAAAAAPQPTIPNLNPRNCGPSCSLSGGVLIGILLNWAL